MPQNDHCWCLNYFRTHTVLCLLHESYPLHMQVSATMTEHLEFTSSVQLPRGVSTFCVCGLFVYEVLDALTPGPYPCPGHRS